MQKNYIQLILQKKNNKKQKKKTTFFSSLHCNKENSYSLVNCTKIIKFKSKDLKILQHPLCLGNISKDWSVDIMKKKNRIKRICLSFYC